MELNPRLKRAHYILVHDALKKIHKACTVNAFVTDRHPFQVDMSAQLSRFDPRDGIKQFAEPLEKCLPHSHVDLRKQKLVIHFPDNAELSLTFGRQGMSIDRINEMENDEERALHRPGLGADNEEFAHNLHPLIRGSVDICMEWAKKQFLAPLLPPQTFWSALCYRISIEHDCYFPHYILDLAQHQMWSQLSRPLCNPVLPSEDLNTLGVIRELCKLYGYQTRDKFFHW